MKPCGSRGERLMMRSLYALLGCCVLSALAATSCSEKTVQKTERMVVPVTVTTVMAKALPVEVSAVGTVEAYTTVAMKSQVNGELVKVHFAEGEEVEKDALLFEIDSRPFEAELKRVEANLARDAAQLKQAEANLARDLAQLRNAEAERQRYEQLIAKGVVATERYEQLRTNAEALEAAVRADRAAIENAGETMRADRAAIENVKIQLGYCSIRSPIEGRTGSLVIQRGNLIKANDTVPLVVINQVSPIRVNFSVPEQYLQDIRKYSAAGALKVEAIVPGEENRPAKGVLTFVDNAVDSATGTIRLKATYENRDRWLWPGQFVSVILTLSTQANAVVVPSEAVQTGQAGAYVFVVTEDLTAESRPVNPGRTVRGETVIEKGLEPGDVVVTDGQLQLVPGARVSVKEPVGGEQKRNS